MKCNRAVIYGWKSQASKKYKPRILASFGKAKYMSDYINQIKTLFSHAEICNGEIESVVELEWIPYYGGADASIEIRFVCNKCKYNHAGENGLPHDVDSLNKFLTEVLEKL